MTKTVIANKETSWETWKALLGPSKSAVITALQNATTKQVKATVMVQYHLYAFDQFFGFSGSFTVKVTSSWSSYFPLFLEIVRLRMTPVVVSSRYSCISALSFRMP
jgi:hypothetical protein